MKAGSLVSVCLQFPCVCLGLGGMGSLVYKFSPDMSWPSGLWACKYLMANPTSIWAMRYLQTQWLQRQHWKPFGYKTVPSIWTIQKKSLHRSLCLSFVGSMWCSCKTTGINCAVWWLSSQISPSQQKGVLSASRCTLVFLQVHSVYRKMCPHVKMNKPRDVWTAASFEKTL